MAFRLRYLSHDLELPVGEFVVGRSAECQLSLDDPLVSRRHAVFRVRKDGVEAADLGSRNGVLVNGVRIDGPRELAVGDKVTIGSQELTLQRAEDGPRQRGDDDFRRATQTLGAVNVKDMPQLGQDPTVAEEPSTRVSSFRLLGGVADKALAMGRAEEAERILQALLFEVRQRARDGKMPDPSVAEHAARYAARLAGTTTKGSWVDYVFELYGAMKRPLPAPVVDELYTVVRRVKSLDLAKLRAYVAELREMQASFGPTERFLVQRIEGLERLGSLK